MKIPRIHRLSYQVVLLAALFGSPAVATALQDGTSRIVPTPQQWVRSFDEAAALSAAEARLRADVADGTLDDMSLLRAALVSSGVDDKTILDAYESKFDEYCQGLAASLPVDAPPQRVARRILEFLHKSVLIDEYDAEATRLDTAIDAGRFNCVSSLVLFCHFAEYLALDTEIVQLPGHVRCAIHGRYGSVVVEPTCADWFHVVNDRQRREKLLGQTTGLQPMSNANQRVITPVQLIAMIYYNRGIELLSSGQYRPAVAANLRSFSIDPNSAIVRGNMLAAVNNWALDLAARGNYAAASELIERGLRLTPTYVHFLQNDIHIHQCWMADLWQGGRYAEALRRLDTAHSRRPDVAYFDVARLEGFRRQAGEFLADQDLAGALDVCEQARRRFPKRTEWLEAEARLVSDYALELARVGEVEKAVECFDLGLERLQGNTLLNHNRRATVAQWASVAYQKKNYAEGIRRCGVVATSKGTELPEHVRYGYHSWIGELVRDGDRQQALAVLDEARTMLPKDHLWHRWQAILDQQLD